MEPEFYIPKNEEWRTAPENLKQGSAGPVDPWTGSVLTENLMKYVEQGEAYYNLAMESGVAPEQARLFLPAYGMYVVYRWSCSLQSACLFLNQRLEQDAQVEIREYAKAMYKLLSPKFPVSMNCLVNSNDI